MSANNAVEGEEQKTILGSDRTVTHASVSGEVYKEWDKATGVYVNAIEHTTNYTVITNVIGTNLWNPKTQQQSQTTSAQLIIATIISAILLLSSMAVIIARKKLVKKV